MWEKTRMCKNHKGTSVYHGTYFNSLSKTPNYVHMDEMCLMYVRVTSSHNQSSMSEVSHNNLWWMEVVNKRNFVLKPSCYHSPAFKMTWGGYVIVKLREVRMPRLDGVETSVERGNITQVFHSIHHSICEHEKSCYLPCLGALIPAPSGT